MLDSAEVPAKAAGEGAASGARRTVSRPTVSKRGLRIRTFALLFAACAACSPPPGDPAAEVAYATASEDETNLRPAAIRGFLRDAGGGPTKGLLVVQHGRIVAERYRDGYGPLRKHHTASLAKSLLGGVGLALALDRGWVTPETPVAKYYTPWVEDERRARITIAQLAAHASGLADAERDGIPHGELDGWEGAFWKRDPNPIATALDEPPVLFEPGSGFAYSNPGYAVLGFALAAAAREAGESDLVAALEREILAPLGIPAAARSLGYGRVYDVDGVPVHANWGGAAFTARALARIGELLAGGGTWNGEQLLSEEAVRATTIDAGFPLDDGPGPQPAPTLGWYSNATRAFAALPDDAFLGAGAGQQVLLVVPSLDLVVVRFGSALAGGGTPFWQAVDEGLVEPLGELLRRPPVEKSPAFAGARFEDAASIRCAAESSDNWPITWAGDDLQYTSYGDGWGFEPKLEDKLSLGLATIAGGPDDFEGKNLRSDAERTGDGPAGAKASGMLALDGALYMWVRNLDNAQLAWSDDGGTTWTWGFVLDESFGSPGFLNYGKEYAGAPDDFVYTFSQDGDSAYESDDGVVLARAPRTRLRDREAWEFWAGDGEWSANLADREPVLRYPGSCARIDVVHHPRSGRLLMALGSDLTGGWAIFDAPAPAGPWTLVFQTPDWGLGATHGYRLPSKWIDPDSNRLALVFSGRRFGDVTYDAFCVRSMELPPRPGPRIPTD